MPQLLGLVLIGAGVIAGLKALQSVAQRVSGEMRRATEAATRCAEEAEPAGSGAKDLGALEFDPKAGVYKPRQG